MNDPATTPGEEENSPYRILQWGDRITDDAEFFNEKTGWISISKSPDPFGINQIIIGTRWSPMLSDFRERKGRPASAYEICRILKKGVDLLIDELGYTGELKTALEEARALVR